MNTFIDLSTSQLLKAVQTLSKRSVNRSSLCRWRKELGLQEPYTIDHARFLAYYGDLLALGFKPKQAEQMTINHFITQEHHG